MRLLLCTFVLLVACKGPEVEGIRATVPTESSESRGDVEATQLPAGQVASVDDLLDPDEVIDGLQLRPASFESLDSVRIWQGKVVDDRALPYVVAFTDGDNKAYCGGTLIAERWVLTAAHCDVQPDHKVWVGTDRLTLIWKQKHAESIHRVELHDAYVPREKSCASQDRRPECGSEDYDVALVELEQSARPKSSNGRSVWPRLAVEPPPAGSELVTAGWGRTTSSGSPSIRLKQAHVLAVEQAACAASWGPVPITPRMLCMKPENGETCQGDSGGPLVKDSDTQVPVVMGIVSFADRGGCGKGFAPAVYTDVAAVQEFIRGFVPKLGFEGG